MTANELRRLAALIERTDLDAIDRAADYLRACADALENGPVAWVKTTRTGARRLDWLERTHYAADDYPVAAQPLYPVALPAKPVSVADGLPPDRIEAIARRTAWRYRKSSDPHHSDSYAFNRAALRDFVARLMAEAEPAPPPECQTEAEKRAYAFGWWKAMEARPRADEKPTDAIRAENEGLRDAIRDLARMVKNPPTLRLPGPMTDGEMLDVLIEASNEMAVNAGHDPESLKLDHGAIRDGFVVGRAIESAILRRVKECNK
jgi:hypothetical protein